MLNKEYPQHDMNLVFDMIENSISKGGVHDKTAEEMNLLMHLYAGLPAEAETGHDVHSRKSMRDPCNLRHHPSSRKTHEPS